MEPGPLPPGPGFLRNMDRLTPYFDGIVQT